MISTRFAIWLCLCLFPLVAVLAAVIYQQQRERNRSLPTTTTPNNSRNYKKASMSDNDDHDDIITMMVEKIPDEATYLHLIVLVHGLWGNAMEMDTLKEYLHQHAGSKQKSCNSQHHFIIHSPKCNEQRTSDGIEAGGTRLAEEINELLHSIRQQGKKQTVTLSFVGNSLGGLYSRYALGGIDFTPPPEKPSGYGDNLVVIPKLFITTVCPHLGVSRNTYVKLPRPIERVVATVLQQTGLDMFSFSPILHQMTFESKFIQPLLKFEKRIAFANAHGTDFQVPTATAAFWEDESDSEHILLSDKDYCDFGCYDKRDEAATTTTTTTAATTTESTDSCPTLLASSSSSYSSESSTSPCDGIKNNPNLGTNKIVGIYKTRQAPNVFVGSIEEGGDEISFSKQLDSLGWTKVLIDVRQNLPSWSATENVKEEEEGLPLQVPTSCRSSSSFSSSSSSSSDTSTSAKELLNRYGGGTFLTVPFGHSIIIANAGDALHRWFNSGGKPIMNYLAGNIIDNLLSPAPSNQAI